MLHVEVFVFVFFGLVVVALSPFWSGTIDVHSFTLDNFRTIFSFSDPTYWRITGRTVGVEEEAVARMILFDRGGIVDEYASMRE